MSFQFIRRLFPVVLTLAVAMLAGCSGGTNGESDSSESRTFSAEGEARRIAVLYTAIRDTANVVMPYLHNAATLIAMDGSTVGCLTSGTAARTYDPGPGSGVEQSLMVQFTNCGETFGVVGGQITVMWNSSADDPAAGSFRPTWFGTFTVNGATYNIERPSPIALNYNASSGHRDALIRVKSLSGLQGPSGPALAMSNVQYHLVDDPASANFQVVDSTSDILTSAGSPQPHGVWRSPAAIQVQRVAASDAIAGVGDPILGGFSYVRVNRSGLREGIEAAPQISGGLLNVTVEGQSSKLTDSGQFDWPGLYASAIYDFDGE